MGGWGGPEKDQILQHCLVQGLAIVHNLAQILLWGSFQGQIQVSWAVIWFLQSGDSIVVQGMVPGQYSVDHHDSSPQLLGAHPRHIREFCTV